jgi:hypothetical protein
MLKDAVGSAALAVVGALAGALLLSAAAAEMSIVWITGAEFCGK